MTKEGVSYVVVEYTNYKEGGPAVYARLKGLDRSNKDLSIIYFFDITKINGTTVEYQKGMKVFNALGKIKRLQHLPQPDDRVTVLAAAHEDAADEEVKVKAEGLKLKSKTLGINKGMFVRDEDGKYYRLKQVQGIKRSLGGSEFDQAEFLSYYKDYIGV
jgi:hypothetical protein